MLRIIQNDFGFLEFMQCSNIIILEIFLSDSNSSICQLTIKFGFLRYLVDRKLNGPLVLINSRHVYMVTRREFVGLSSCISVFHRVLRCSYLLFNETCHVGKETL